MQGDRHYCTLVGGHKIKDNSIARYETDNRRQPWALRSWNCGEKHPGTAPKRSMVPPHCPIEPIHRPRISYQSTVRRYIRSPLCGNPTSGSRTRNKANDFTSRNLSSCMGDVIAVGRQSVAVAPILHSQKIFNTSLVLVLVIWDDRGDWSR